MKSLNCLKTGLALIAITLLGLGTFQTVDTLASTLSNNKQCLRSKNMVGWWEFDEVVGLTAVDKSGNNNNGVYVSNLFPTLPSSNGVLNFDGIDDYVSVPDAPSLNFGKGNFSVCFYIKTSSSGLDVIIDKRVEVSGPVKGWVVFIDNGNLALQLSNGTGGFMDYRSNAFIADNKWHQVILTVERSQTNVGKWYVDGMLKEKFNPRSGDNLINSIPLTIGRRSDNPGWSGIFKGSIDNVKLFNRAL